MNNLSKKTGKTSYYKQYVKLNILLPIFMGLVIGSILYFNRVFDDIPGLPIIVLISCFLLIYYGVHNVNKINKKIKPNVIVPVFFGILGIIGMLILLINGGLIDSPGFFIVLNVLYTGCLFIGIFNIKIIRQKIDPGIFVPVFYCVCGIILAISAEFDGEISMIQRILIIVILLFIGFLSISIITLVRKLINKNNNKI
ncbi:MAG: hypothetical protein LBS55_03725 [Prevotellaceae bacterium]|jgi:hypothetical protein|nr:hypothetical protein [Prevotellaceae bacterium]